MLKLDAARPLAVLLMGRATIDLNPLDYYQTLADSQAFKKYLGGSPANIAVGLARLGNKVGFIGRVSADRFGDYIEQVFRQEGVDVKGLSRAENGERLGLTFTEILSPEESSILMYRDRVADLTLPPEEIDEAAIARAQMLLLSGTALSQSPSREAVLKAALLAQRSDTRIVFDLDYRPYSWRSLDEVGVYGALVGQRADILIGSRQEFDLIEAHLGLDGTDAASAAYWLSQKAKLVVIKHGKEGSMAFTPKAVYQIKPFPVTMLKGFGGGDAYASALLHGIIKGYPLKRCFEMASASAAMLVASHGCSADMPTEEAIDSFIKGQTALTEAVVLEHTRHQL